jgi:hypothetical protein
VELKLNGTHQLLAYADDVNLLGYTIDTMKRNTETLDSNGEADIEIEMEKAKNMSVSFHQNTGQNYNIKIAIRSFENVTEFSYLGMTVTN